MASWGDMSLVKKNLWNKLHNAKDTVQQGVINLAQIISAGAGKLLGPIDDSFV
jgi:hypothetical protein